MNRFARRARAAVTLTAIALGALSAATPFAAASVTSAGITVPFKDPYIDGWLTFCNQKGQPVTSGSLDARPFAWKIIASSKAPAGFSGREARAVLYAYQPLKYVNPGDWSGNLLTGSSEFTNPRHPVVQATNADQPLLFFTQAFPPHWDGLVEIRMNFISLGKGELQEPYPAAILHISGNTWTLVKGGGGSCSQGQGVSNETKMLPKKDLVKAPTVVFVKPGHTQAAHSGTAGHSSASADPAVGGQSSNGSSTGGAKLASADSSTGINGGVLAGIGVGVLAVVWAAIALIGRRRRHTAS